MGFVADLSNVYRGTIQGRYPPVNSPKCPLSLPLARILFPASPTCGIIPPHRALGHASLQMGRIH
jgi:hypothetical protein